MHRAIRMFIVTAALAIGFSIVSDGPAYAAEQEPKHGVKVNIDPEGGSFDCEITECCTGWPCPITGPSCCWVGN